MPIEKAYGYFVGFNLISRAQEEIGNRIEIYEPLSRLSRTNGSHFIPPSSSTAELPSLPTDSLSKTVDGFSCHSYNVPRPSYFTFPAKLVKALNDSDVDLVHSHTRIGLPISLLGLDRPHIVHLHGLPYFAVEQNLGFKRYDMEAYCYMRAFLRDADIVVCYCWGLARRVVEIFGIDPSKIRVIYNGVDPHIFKQDDVPDDRLPWMRRFLGVGDRPIVLFVGRAEPIKGAREFLQSLPMVVREIPDLRVVVIGSGWERLLHEWSGFRKVIIIPHLNYKRIGEAYRAADVHVAITKVYGYQKTTMEAASCGTTVVATDNADNRMVCGNSGIYVNPFDPVDIAAGIMRGLKAGPTHRELDKTARNVRQRFTWRGAAEQCQRVYRAICDV